MVLVNNDEKKILICRISGGLGNQLFQYAFAKEFILKTGARLLLDTRSFTPGNKRNLELFHFPIQADVLTNEHLDSLPNEISCLNQTHGFWFYDKISINDTDFPLYAHGMWQSWKYFISAEQILRSEFCFQTKKISNKAIGLGDVLSKTPSVGIHIRRTDYANHSQLCILPNSYYYNAVNFFKQKNTEYVFYVFLDDPDWVESSFNIPSSFQIVRDNTGFEDLYLMSQCQNNIIANSTFSWWGAWLNNNSNKMIVVPKYWTSGKGIDITKTDLIPCDWICLW